jgi:O-antigen/teichoic acid export membrane protein
MLLRHSGIYALARGLPGVINFLAIAIWTRLLPPEQYGRYALVIAGAMLANKVVFGWLRLGVLRFLPGLGAGQQAFLSTMKAGFVLMVGLTGVVGGIAMLLVSDPTKRGLLAAGLVLLWSQSLFELHSEIARSQLSPVRYGLLALAKSLLALALGVGLVALGFGAYGLILGLALGMLVAVAPEAVRNFRGTRVRLCERAWLRHLWLYGAPLSGTAALVFVVASSDRFLIAWLLGEDSVGLYAVGYDLASNGMVLLLMIINLAAYPLAVRALEQQGAAAAARYLLQNGTALLAIGLPAMAGLVLLAPNLAHVLVGQAFRADATALIPIIALAALLNGLKEYHLDLAFQLGRQTMWQLWITLSVAAVNVVLNLWWIPVFGIMGAAYATLVAFALGMLLSWRLGRRVFRIPWPGGDSVKIALATVGMGGAIWLVVDGRGVVPLVGQVLCGVATYGALCWLLDVGGARRKLPLKVARSVS